MSDISTLGFPRRLENMLRLDGLETVEQLSQRSAAELLRISNLGRGYLRDIEAALLSCGLHLKPRTGDFGDNRTVKGAGRPSTYDPGLGERIVAIMSEGLSLAAAAAECDVHRRRVYDWEQVHPDFAELVALARVKRQAFLERRLLTADVGPVVTSSIFALKNAAPEDWRDKQEVEHSNPDGTLKQPTTIQIVAAAAPKAADDDGDD